MRALLATVVAALIVIAPATAEAASVTTGAAQPGTTTATLTGTVNPEGVSTDYYFEYGTTTGYGVPTAQESAGSGTAGVQVQKTISGLSPNTTYHYRLVAVQQGSTVATGLDRTFTTAAAPATPGAPSISRLSAVDKTPTSARLTARIDPNRATTAWHIEWGTTANLGRSTPEQTIPTGDGGVPISVPLDDLPTHTKIYWRVVAGNAAGLRRSGTASFTTLRAPAGITVRVFPQTAPWSGDVQVSGRVEGSGVNGMRVGLEQSEFPYTAGFQPVATVRTGGRGEFHFPSRTVLVATRYRVVTRSTVSVTSPVVSAGVRARVGIRRTAKRRLALTLTGRVQPGLPDGLATLQRGTRSGGWKLVRRKALTTASTTESSYRFRVRRLRRAAVYRVKVAANDGGAHLGATSRALLVGKKQKRRR
jgi:hypothetical protein